MVKDFLSERAAEGRFSQDSLRLMLCTLRVIYNHAIDDELLEQNPAAKLGKFTKGGRPKRQATALTRPEGDRLLRAAGE